MVVENKMSSNSIFAASWNHASEVESSYSRLCVLALLSAFFGAGTFLVYFTPWFCFLGVIALLLGLFACWAIRNADGLLTGLSLAYFGLCSAIVALVSIAVFWSVYQNGIRREADQFFRLWFVAAQQGNVPQAKGYWSMYMNRSKAASADEWWKNQYEDKYAHRAVHQFVEDKLFRVLMALGGKAKVTYYKTLKINSERESNTANLVYAVSFPAESGGTHTFFVTISGKRSYPVGSPDFKAAGWRIEGVPVFYFPNEFKKQSETADQ